MLGEFTAQLNTLPQHLSGHLLLCFFALVFGIMVSVPLGVFATRRPKLEKYISGTVSILQTIPSLALLALMVPMLGGTIGWQPALIALTIYSMLPVLRNTITGLEEVDWATVEAGRSVGMTERQLLYNVTFPLALPVIVAGIRTSVIWVVGTATLATPVGADSLGYYIFLGLNTRQTGIILIGCLFSALLAIILERLTAGIEALLQARKGRQAKVLFVIMLSLVFVGIASPYLQDFFEPDSYPVIVEGGVEELEPKQIKGLKLVIGAKQFTEQYILADVLRRYLEAEGGEVSVKTGLGSKLLYDALEASSIDLYVDYTGTVWSTVLKKAEVVPPQVMLIKVSSYLLENAGILNIGALGFTNAYAFAMKKSHADELGIDSIADLAKISQELEVAADFDFYGRIESKQVKKIYGLRFKERRHMNSRLMYDAVDSGTVDVVTAYATDGQIPAFELKILSDPLGALPPYDAIMLLSPKASKHLPLVQYLRRLVNQIDLKMMQKANMEVDMEGRSIEEVGQELYEELQARLRLDSF